MVKDTIDVNPVVGDCEDGTSTSLLCEATDTLVDCASEDWLLEDVVPAVVIGELSSLVLETIVNDWLVKELVNTVLDTVLDEAIVLLLEVLD